MTLGQLKQNLGSEFIFQDQPNFMVDWGAIVFLKAGKAQFYLLHPAGVPLKDGDAITLIATENSDFQTAEGIGPDSSIEKAVKVYGAATLSYNTDDEMREYVGFANAPADLSFRTNGTPGNFVGIYDDTESGSYHETQDFEPQGTIARIMVDGSRRQSPSAAVPSETSANPEAANSVDCSQPQATAGTNFCSKQAYEQADTTLNQEYQNLMGQLNTSTQNQLQVVETAWLQFRDAHCRAVTAGLTKDPAYESLLNGCLAEATEFRTGQLRQAMGELPRSDQRNSGIGRVTVSGQEIDCDNPQGTPVINYCAELAYEKADQALNQTYQQLTAKLDPATQKLLTAAQVAWLEFRDRHCDFATREAQGGTGYEAYRNNCLEDLSRDRTQELINWLSL
jgi:uncharacterized protein YecT (DUF1311 family)